MNSPVSFTNAAKDALANPTLRSNFREAMDSLRERRANQFPDPVELESARDLASAIRARALKNLPQNLITLEAQCQANGIQVHWADTPAEANEIILGICQRHDAKHVIKGKSMVSEECHLNAFLEQHGIEALESDLGEYIVQIDGETPSHIIMPAIHKNKKEIAELFAEKIPGVEYTEDVDTLTAIARKVLRTKFETAAVGISGVNFAVAETGTLCLVENEGNGRMTTTVPPVHIAITGIEKVVPQLADVPPLYSVLTRSATGQHATTYFNMISSPRKPGEMDGPDEVHLVLLDNGRSKIFNDDAMRDTLKCIRCGACMNHCPVYTRIGGHAYGTVYPGPIGQILNPQQYGIDKQGEMLSACSLNGACGEACPVRIPIPQLISKLRHEATRNDRAGTVYGQGALRKWYEALVWQSWQWIHQRPALYRTMTWSATRFRGLLPEKAMGPWTKSRIKPALARKTLHEMMKDKR
ncbi:LutB/LldF family L-lactate oxidation iron-sulfur protein [Litorivicinus lipolyticus]|uniref:LutB/LldF family L-lactate oxidation iron-sulfur protein n=1 Tax=Litorivicinus lipolyticus TaxID=418701 RepID=UPI003B5A8BFF